MKIGIANISQKQEWKFPSFVVRAIQEKFKKSEILISNDMISLSKDLKDADLIISLPLELPMLRKLNAKGAIIVGSGIPETFKKYFSDKFLHNLAGINANLVAKYSLSLVEKMINVSNFSSIKLGIVGSGFIAQEISILWQQDHIDSILDQKKGELFCLSRTDKKLGQKFFSIEDMKHRNEFIKECDIVIFAIESNSQTIKYCTDMYKELSLSLFDKTRGLINISRGDLIEELDLIRLLESKKFYYYTDVTVPEVYPENGLLRSYENVFISNHIAGTSSDIWQVYLPHIIEKIEQFTASKQ